MVRSSGIYTTRTICEIQGNGKTSPFIGETVVVQGVVTADFDDSSRRGFYLQHENCDGDEATSDGVFVYLGERVDVVQSGDLISVSGEVDEYFGFTEIETISTTITIVSSGNALPPPVDLNPPQDEAAALIYFEAREGMLVKLDSAIVVGPTNKNDETWVVNSDLGVGRVYRADPNGTGAVICVDEAGLFEITPEAQVGDQIMGLAGVLDYSYGLFRLQLLANPILSPGDLTPESGVKTSGNQITAATLNLENLFDSVDDFTTEDNVPTETAYQRKLKKLAQLIHSELKEPLILAVQEAENETVLAALVSRPEIEVDYDYVLVPGPDVRGIDVAILYQQPQVSLISATQQQKCTDLVDGLGPDGNKNVDFPANAKTCDRDGDGILDGNRLFSRPPLVAEFSVQLSGGSEKLVVIANHWKSKGQDTSSNEYTLPRRIKQAEFVVNLVEDILASDGETNLIVLGDLNDYVDSQPLGILERAGLTNLVHQIEETQRYTYIYQGVSQVLDHILVSAVLEEKPTQVSIPHQNADFPYVYRGDADTPRRSSDHDPVWAGFAFEPFAKSYRVYVPLIIRNPSFPFTKLLISEVMYDVTDEPEEEWIELYNASSGPVDLSEYKIGDEETAGGSEGMLQFPNGGQVASREVIIIANRGTAFQTVYGFSPNFEIHDTDAGIPDMEVYALWGTRNMQLGNSGDEVLLLAADDSIHDAVSWGSSKFAFDPAAKDVAEGHSLERYPTYQASTGKEDWRDQAHPAPGEVDLSSPSPTPTPTPTPTPPPTPEPTPFPPIVINEIHADPASDLSGDANGDGIRDGSDDEFIEIVNTVDFPIDISGWTIKDRVNLRHVFLNGTIIQPSGSVVIFGGGLPTGSFGNCPVQVSTKGGLGLNNSGDTVTLYDLRSQIVDAVVYDSIASDDQSITRDPDIVGSFGKHLEVFPVGQNRFSPGLQGNLNHFSGCSE